MASVVWMLLAPTVYLVLATFGLLQFSLAYSALGALARQLDHVPALEGVVPLLRAYTHYLESIFGPAYKFTPTSTQVTLVALMLVLLSRR